MSSTQSSSSVSTSPNPFGSSLNLENKAYYNPFSTSFLPTSSVSSSNPFSASSTTQPSKNYAEQLNANYTPLPSESVSTIQPSTSSTSKPSTCVCFMGRLDPCLNSREGKTCALSFAPSAQTQAKAKTQTQTQTQKRTHEPTNKFPESKSKRGKAEKFIPKLSEDLEQKLTEQEFLIEQLTAQLNQEKSKVKFLTKKINQNDEKNKTIAFEACKSLLNKFNLDLLED